MFPKLLGFLGIQTTGYRPQNLVTDASWGAVHGVRWALWAYVFASLIFTGALAPYLPLAAIVFLVGTAVIGIVVGLTSKVATNVAAADAQAAAILSSIAVLMNARIDAFAGPAAMASTMFFIIALSTLLFGLCFHLIARFRLGLLIQLIPLPVVCGFLAGIGWLLFAAGLAEVAHLKVNLGNAVQLFEPKRMAQWLPAMVAGAAILWLTSRKTNPVVLPGALLAGIAGFYAVVLALEIPLQTLRETGWLFDIDGETGVAALASLSLDQVSFRFVASALPEIATLVLIALLIASLSLSALELATGALLDLGHELKSHGTANLASGLVLGLPGYTKVAATVTNQRLGGSSRLLPLLSGAIPIIFAVAGGAFIGFLPKVVLASLIFMVAFQFLYDWMVVACRSMGTSDRLTVWAIFAVIVMIGFIPGITLGIMLTSLMFIVRYSKMGIVRSAFSLAQVGSTVDRSPVETKIIGRFGNEVKVFNLRGFVFFGSASLFFETIKIMCQTEPGYRYVIFDFKSVLGIDSTATQVFSKIINFLESQGIEPIFCGMNAAVAEAFQVSNVVTGDEFLVLSDLDLALRSTEEILLDNRLHRAHALNIHDILVEIIKDKEKAALLVGIMDRLELKRGDYLFRQGDTDSSLYVIESGSIEVRLEKLDGSAIRLREFRPGTVVGEMAAYTDSKQRSASAIAMRPTVVYRLVPENVKKLPDRARECETALHEFVARLLAARLTFMNKRMEVEI
ncbi:MAG: SulP family inorganic anion transporter [Rhodospirillales bacterium]